MAKLHQIHEDDLAELERILPDWAMIVSERTGGGNNRDKVQIRRVREIITNVRWNYQPHTEIEQIGDEDGSE